MVTDLKILTLSPDWYPNRRTCRASVYHVQEPLEQHVVLNAEVQRMSIVEFTHRPIISAVCLSLRVQAFPPFFSILQRIFIQGKSNKRIGLSNPLSPSEELLLELIHVPSRPICSENSPSFSTFVQENRIDYLTFSL